MGRNIEKQVMMKIEKFIKYIIRAIEPKSFFGFYFLMYLLPQIIPLYIAGKLCGKLFNNGVDYIVLRWVLVYAGIISTWNLFFIIYFTRVRTRNPHLYGKGFVSGFRELTKTTDLTEGKADKDLTEEKIEKEVKG